MKLNKEQTDVLKEIFNIGAGKAANILATYTSAHFELKVPEVKILKNTECQEYFNLEFKDSKVSQVSLPFTGNINGQTTLLFNTESASNLVSNLADEPGSSEELNELSEAVLTEVGNIVLNSVMGSMSNMFEIHLDYRIPIYQSDRSSDTIISTAGQSLVILARATFASSDLKIKGDILILLDQKSNEDLEKFLTKLAA